MIILERFQADTMKRYCTNPFQFSTGISTINCTLHVSSAKLHFFFCTVRMEKKCKGNLPRSDIFL